MDTGPDFFLEILSLLVYDFTEDSLKLAKYATDIYENDIKGNSMIDDELTKMYVGFIRDVIKNEVDLNNPAEIGKILLSVKSHPEVIRDNSIYMNIEKMMTCDRTLITPRRILNLQRKIKGWIMLSKSQSSIRRMFKKSTQCQSSSDTDRQNILLNEILEESRELAKAFESNVTSENATLDFIDMSCKASITKGINKNKKKNAKKGYTTGLQGVNRMFGVNGGPLPGEFICVAALSHNYKSGLLMDFARWMTTLNKPRNDDGKIPCVVFISLENEVHENMMQWFVAAYINIYKEKPSKRMTDEEIIEKVYEIYNQNGIKLLVYRKVGELFGYEDWATLHLQLIEQGYHVMASILDYITPMKLEDSKVFEAKKIQRLCHKMKTFADQQQITVITALQLGTAAYELASSDVSHVVKKFTAFHLAECKSARQEFDVFIYAHIEKNHLDVPYLTLKLDKHRYVSSTPLEDKSTAYRFMGELGIMNDIEGKDMSVANIYADGESEADTASAASF